MRKTLKSAELQWEFTTFVLVIVLGMFLFWGLSTSFINPLTIKSVMSDAEAKSFNEGFNSVK